MMGDRGQAGILVGVAVSAAGVFLLDLLTPLGITAYGLYSGVVLLASWLPHHHVVATALGCTALVPIGALLSPPGVVPPEFALSNRLIGIAGVWLVAYLVLLRKKSEARERATLDLLSRHRHAQERLVTAVQELSLARSLDAVMTIVRKAARELNGADGATFVLRDGDFCHYADEDAIASLWKGRRFPMQTCISGWAMLNRQAAVIEDIYADPRIPADAYRPTFVKSLVMVPIRTAAPIGAIGNYWATRRAPGPDEVKLLQALADSTSVAMENVQLYTDLEQRVNARTAELESVSRELDRFFTLSLDLFCVAGTDGYFKRLNPAWARTLGYATEELLATPWLHFVHPDDREATIQAAQRQSTGEGILAFENRYRCKDGSYRWLSWTASPVLERGIIYATARDITERKQTAEALVQSAEQLEVATSAAKIGVWDWNIRENTLAYNDRMCALYGLTKEDFGGVYEAWLAAVHPDDQRQCDEAIQQALRGEKPYDIEFRVRWPNGTIRDIKADGRVIWNPLGKPLRMIGTNYDITERKQAEQAITRANERLEAANKELEAFSYSVSHDLRAPLRHIQGFAQILRQEAAAILSAEHREYVELIVKAATRMGCLIDDLLQFSRIGRTEMRVASVDMDLMVKEVITTLAPDTERRQIEWRIGTLPVVAGDAALLRQVLANLIGNAVKFTARCEGAVIEIGAMDGDPAHPSEAVVYVRDNGAGFDMRYADKLFGVFQRLHRAEEYDGTGIGLANVKRIVHRHGGRVWAEGQVGIGATFFLALPKSTGGMGV